MAEIFGVVASAASLLEITLKCAKVLHGLQQDLKNAPDLILALSNETQDLCVLLTRLEDTRKAAEAANLNTPEATATLTQMEVQMGKAKIILGELDSLIQELAAEEPAMRRVKWVRKKSQAANLQHRLREVRRNISELLAALTKYVILDKRFSNISLIDIEQYSVEVHLVGDTRIPHRGSAKPLCICPDAGRELASH